MYVVARRNLRTGRVRVVSEYATADRAEERAACGNEMHRACKMFHYVDRAFYVDPVTQASHELHPEFDR